MHNLKDSIFKFLRLDHLVASLSGYIETRLELYKVEIREEVGKALSRAMVYAVIGVFAFLFLIFFSVGLAQFLNSILTHAFAGYWIVAGIYGLGFLLMVLFKKDIDSLFEKRFVEMTRRKDK